ncbi:hypothetical protein APASM_5818 [Actinosynnema pretiosum subsp. pretiosum]|nr:hypothetical protein APASM_5818 [Actinosynnema pretiosum subsp. pretiosum]
MPYDGGKGEARAHAAVSFLGCPRPCPVQAIGGRVPDSRF